MNQDADERETVVAEHYHVFTNIPVAICVLETRAGHFHVGFSAVSRHKFDPEVAQSFAKSRAVSLMRSTMRGRA